MRARRARTLVVMLSLAMLAAACGGSGDVDSGPVEDGTSQVDSGAGDGSDEDEGPSGESGTEAALEQAAADTFAAFVAGDDQTYFNTLSRACREEFEFAAVQAHLQGRRFRAETLGGIDLSGVAAASATVDGFGGDSADVSLVIVGTDEAFQESLPQRWVFEEGGWRLDECSDFQEAQGGLEGQGSDRSDPLPYGGVADIAGWLVALTYINPDDEALIVEMGGAPASEGNQLFTAQVSITYNGAETAIAVSGELAFAMVADDTVYGDDASCDVEGFGTNFDPSVTVGPGETAGNPILCRQVAAADANELLLRVTHLPSAAEYWFDLGQP